MDVFKRPSPKQPDTPYLEQCLRFQDGKILDSGGWAVMMEWEKPLMEMHAEYVCWADVDNEVGPFVVNIGHGMSIVDTAIQSHNPAFHLVVEAHPQIYLRAQTWATSFPQSNIRVVHGKWQEVLLAEVEKLGRKLDGLFFDTWEETVEDLIPLLPLILRPNGRFSFCNMYQPHDALRHAAYSLYLAARLAALDITCTFRLVDNPAAEEEQPNSENVGEVWHDVRYAYWTHDAYLLPLCVLDGTARTSSPAVLVAQRLDGDGRPAQMLIWNAKLWYLCSLFDDAGDETAESLGGRGGSISDKAPHPREGSLRVIWRRHCVAAAAAQQATNASAGSAACEQGAHVQDAESGGGPTASPRKKRKARGDGDVEVAPADAKAGSHEPAAATPP